MNKKITLLTVLVAFAASSFAQISFDQNNFEEPNYSKDEFSYDAKAYLTNTATDESDTLFAWELTKVDVPSEWSTTVCSGDLCIEEPTRPFNFVAKKDEKILFKLGYAFFGEAGTGVSYIVAYSLKNPLNTDTLRLDLTARDLVSARSIDKSSLRVYPNPAKDKVFVDYNTANYTVNVYDILGNLKISKNINKGESIAVSELATGVYVVRVEGDLSFSKVLQKQ